MAGKTFEYKEKARKTYIYLHDTYATFRYVSYDNCWSVTGTYNKMALVSTGDTPKQKVHNTSSRLKEFVHGTGFVHRDVPKKGNSLFISKECSTPRDIIRKSGFKIVNDPDSADYIVIPHTTSVKWEEERCNVVACDGVTLYLFCIERMQTGRRGHVTGDNTLSDEEMQYVNELLSRQMSSAFEIYYNPGMRSTIVSFCPKIKEFEEIVCETKPNAKYISNTFLELDSVSEVNPETLQIWDKMEKDVFMRSVVNSNWREYPYTIKTLIELRGFFLHSISSAYNEMVRTLDEVDYEGHKVSVKDWNMCQKLFMIHLGVSETGGYASKDIFDNLNYSQRKSVNCRFAVKPFFLQENDEMEIPLSEIRSKF